jgi:hypothetical protein
MDRRYRSATAMVRTQVWIVAVMEVVLVMVMDDGF